VKTRAQARTCLPIFESIEYILIVLGKHRNN
jgi:hypothetical protein